MQTCVSEKNPRRKTSKANADIYDDVILQCAPAVLWQQVSFFFFFYII